jgi:hypothetical protein
MNCSIKPLSVDLFLDIGRGYAPFVESLKASLRAVNILGLSTYFGIY